MSVLFLWSIILLENLTSHCFGLIYKGCSLGTDRVVSYDNSLIHPSNITASSQEPTFNPDNNLFNRNNSPLRLWCTEGFQASALANTSGEVSLAELLRMNSAGITINVTFTRPLLLTHIVSSGFVNGFVKSFSIQTSPDLEGPFSTYHSSKGEHTFEVGHIDTALILAPPIAARRIRLDIWDGVLTPTLQLCWHLTLLGCTLNEANLLQDPAVASPKLPQCSRIGTVSTSSLPTPSISISHSASASCPVMTITKTVSKAATPTPTPSLTSLVSSPEIMPTPDSLVLSVSCPAIITKTVEVVAGPCISASASSNFTSDMASMPVSTAWAGPANNVTRSEDGKVSKECHRYRLILYVVPSAAVGLLILACLGFVCVSAYIHCRCNRSKKRSGSKGESGIMMDNVLYESRDQACPIPKEEDDSLGMVDNELYKTRSSVVPASVLNTKPSPSLDHSSSFNGIPRRNGNFAYNGRNGEAVYENCRRFYTASKRSTFGDSMNNRSTVTTDLEQSIRSVDSMMDNPTYSVPFSQPVDYHTVTIYPQRNPPKGAYNIPTTTNGTKNFLAKGISAIDMVDNDCYSVPSSLSRQDEMEHSLMARQQFQPMEYETPK